MMQLSFANTHLSITSFPTIDLPDFSVVTGPNGAGKSHLLQAIENGSIQTNVASSNMPGQVIRRFDWTNLVPQDTGGITSETLRQERESFQQQFTNLLNNQAAQEPGRAVLRARGLPQKFINDPYALLNKAREREFEDYFGNPLELESLKAEVRNAAEQASGWLIQNFDQGIQASLLSLKETHGVPIVSLTSQQVNSSAFRNWGRTDLFQQSFARLFVAYRDAELANRLAEFNAFKGYSDDEFLTESEFESQYGPKPWLFVNETINRAGLDFKINEPARNDFVPYTPRLTKVSTGATIPFSNLSSGEKVLMSFAFCVYYANDKRQLATYPRVLLFDEIDAPLHPSMSRSLLNTIQGTLVRDFGIKVIATTHSPSTVALAPEDAVHLMKPNVPGLHRTSKSEALNILTVDVPTIAISYDGRRQVFVESPSDARVYDSIYKVLKPRLLSERSLEFVATGTRSPDGLERNTGCEVVKRLVSDLVSAGNQSVFGLIDHDGKHKANGRLFVLGQGGRNGLENYILDPLLLVNLIARDLPTERTKIGLEHDISYLKVLKADQLYLQTLVAKMESNLFDEVSQQMQSLYVGGLVLNVDETWSSMDDHKLEALIHERLPAIHSISRQQSGRLMNHVVTTILVDAPELVPVGIQRTFRDLLEVEAHC